MVVYVVYYMPQVGDELIEDVFATEALAKAYITNQTYPGQYGFHPMPVRGEL